MGVGSCVCGCLCVWIWGFASSLIHTHTEKEFARICRKTTIDIDVCVTKKRSDTLRDFYSVNVIYFLSRVDHGFKIAHLRKNNYYDQKETLTDIQYLSSNSHKPTKVNFTFDACSQNRAEMKGMPAYISTIE